MQLSRSFGLFGKHLYKVTILAAVFVVFVATVVFAAGEPKASFKPKDGFVPNEETAIKIAVAVWEAIYGKDHIAGEKPYRAHLNTSGVWVVEGSLPDGWVGGVAVAEIAKDDGRILRVSHGK